MSLRELVTGNDACTPDDGAGPSNAFAGLANNLLGTSSKQQERLNELPGLQGVPRSSEARFVPQRPEDAARAALESEQVPIPGMFQGSRLDVDEFVRGAPNFSAAPGSHWHSEFQQLASEGPRPGTSALLGRPTAGPLAPFLHAFFDSAKSRTEFQPLPSPKLPLTLEDQCRIRDRSTILARHMFADSGDAFADEQVGRLLQSLHIDPRSLPSQSEANWNHIFQNGASRLNGSGFDQASSQAHQRNIARPDVDRWADQFANLRLDQGDQENEMIKDFLREQGADGNLGWAEEFQTEPATDWANEFRQSQAVSQGESSTQANAAGALEQTRALRDTLASSADPKMRNSKFLQFLSKMSRGEIILEDNQAKEVPGAAVGDSWAEEHANEALEANFEDAWRDYGQRGEGGRGTWADEFQGEMHPQNEWADQFGTETLAENWASDFAESSGQQLFTGNLGDQEYQFSPNNPFLSDPNSFAKGKELFKNGLLSEAVLAFEAQVQREPQDVEAWRLLGTVHAENDDDQRAIAALGKALQVAPSNAEVLLSLGVSYTNELDQSRALSYLLEWLKGQPGQAAAASVQLPRDARERLRAVVEVFRSAAQVVRPLISASLHVPKNAGSADVHVALGVLYNLSRDYDGAVGAFRTALQTRSADYSLWNKLGATLANSGRSGEAVSAYQRALDLKPNYMRAWTNMGISQANIGEYEESARFYVRALGLNPQASNVWGYLRTSVTCAGRNELLQAIEDEDLQHLQAALPL